MRRHISQATSALTLTTFVLTILVAMEPARAQAGGSVPALLQQYGIRALTPPSAASDFTLPNLAGGESSLSDFYGSWVVLTFFATWCGPCRQELPSLEKLHQDRASRGVVVLGVSVDDTRAPLDPFIQQLGLTFPIVWDNTKRIGSTYRASSIPISYLVDPAGRLVGVSRGSRDWSALTPMMDAALAAIPATLTLDPQPAQDAYADASEPVATPQVSDPPTAEVLVETETPVAGQPFYLDVKLHWAGNFNEYLPHPPEVLLPEGVIQESVTAESASPDGSNQLTYRMMLRADEPGKYALDPVELSYTPRLEATRVSSRVLGPTVEVKPHTMLGLTPPMLAASVGGLISLGLLVFFAVGKLRARGGPRIAPDADLFEALKSELDEARKKRLQGDGAGYLLGLAALDKRLRQARGEPEQDETTSSAMKDAEERARYGGVVPPAEELEQLYRKVERRLEDLRPDPKKGQRQDLKLKD